MKNNFWKALGPGLIWACAAVGVSHLVQSTRAGAAFGFDLFFLVLIINLLKYPFFEYGPRYAISTGESLVYGYLRIGKWAVYLFLIMTLGTMFTIQSAVTAVTVGILSSIFPEVFSYQGWIIFIFSLCLVIVVIGRYKALDRIVKVIVIVLSLSTVVAVIAAAIKGYTPNPEFAGSFSWKSASDIAFLIAIAGWMPSAIDISVWHSMWTMAKIKQTGYRPKLREVLLDFKIGYIGTTLLAVAFLSLGALAMHGSGIDFSQNGATFATQLFNLYTSSIGSWAYPVIAIAAATTMFSTTLTVIDAYPRVMKPVTQILVPAFNTPKAGRYINIFWVLVLLSGAFLIMTSFSSQLKLLVDIATSLSFITAPVLGYINFRAVTGKNVAPENQPGKTLRILSWIGLIILSAFALYFIGTKIF
ncbi:MAG: NRAMP family divalent metal transporter [Tangfeifania sp.]